MKRKEQISQASFQMLFDYLAGFTLIKDERFEPHLKQLLVGMWCNRREEILHHEGDICKKAWFITRGMIYLFFLEPKKDEAVIFMLFRTGEVALIPDSFMNGKPATCFVMACAGTELLEVTKAQVARMHELFPQIMQQEIGILAAITEKANERNVLLCLEPKLRIMAFFAQYPELKPQTKTVKMTDKTIANYLNLSQAHYCRIKNKIFTKKARKS